MSDLVAGRFPTTDPKWLLDGSPYPPYRDTLNGSRLFGAGTFTLATATMYIYPIVVQPGDIFNFLTVIVKTQATATASHCWAALYNGTTATATLVAKTADTTAGWGTGAQKLALLSAAANSGTVGTPQGPSTAATVNSGAAVWGLVLYNSTSGTGTILDAATVGGDVAGNIALTGQIPVTQTATLTATGTIPAALNASGVGTLTAASANVPYAVLSNA
jgi:hypothetical protein